MIYETEILNLSLSLATSFRDWGKSEGSGIGGSKKHMRLLEEMQGHEAQTNTRQILRHCSPCRGRETVLCSCSRHSRWKGQRKKQEIFEQGNLG
jgi:hypothetical protein